MANSAKRDGKRPHPKAEFSREQFEGVVKRLLQTPPLTQKALHRKLKGRKKLGKVLGANDGPTLA